jgi:hypothetical protein
MKNKTVFATLSAVALFGLAAGCTPEARQDVGEAGANVGQATEKSVEGTAKAADRAGDAVAEGTERAVESTAKAADQAGDTIAAGARNAAEATERGVENAAQATSKAVESGAKEVADAGQVLTLTPKVKNALYADEKISGYKLNVDTSGEKDTVVIKGGPVSQSEKARITKIAKQAVGNANVKISNQVTVK